MSNQEKKVPASLAQKSGMAKYVITTIIVLIALSFVVEVYGAFTQGRPLNLEMINKFLDTLISLMGQPTPDQ